MKLFIVLLVLSLNVYFGMTATKLCFPICNTGCPDIYYNTCGGGGGSGGCKGTMAFSVPGGAGSTYSCIKTPYSYYSTGAKWQPTGISPDIPMTYTMNVTTNITIQPLSPSPSTAGTCTINGSASYSFYTNAGGTTFTVNHPGVVGSVYYYQVRIIYAIIFPDLSNSNSYPNIAVTTTFLTNTSSTPAVDTLGGGGSNINACGSGGAFQRYKAISHDWAYNDTVPFDFSITTNDSTKTWGIMNIIISVRLCHPYCTICTGDSNINVCSACDYYGQQAKLSGSTCNLVCANGYGDQTADPSVCIACEALCKYCLDLPETCLNCNSPLLLLNNTATNISCVTACPEHYYANTTGNDTCMVCDASCLNCTSIPTKCTACYNGTYLYNFTCVNPCPAQYYADDPTLTCKACNNYCYTCAVTPTNCSVCDTTGPWISYLLSPNTCTTNCGNGYYADTNNSLGPNTCQACDPKCFTCAINSTYCFGCNTNYYLLNNFCGTSCPFPDYFPDNATWTCLSCATSCVNMTMDLYWKNSLHEDLVCDLTFTQDLNWTTVDIQRFLSVSVDDPLISLDNFNFVYEVISPRIMRLTLSPKGYTFIYNVTFNFKTMSLINNQYDYAANMYRFSDGNYDVSASISWFLIKAPSLSDTQKKIMDSVSGFSSKILAVTTLPYVQQIKKAGIFAMLMGGAQVTSTACLINSIPSQNFYEGVRLWAAFVFFDVPPWEQDSNKTKYVVVPNVHDLIKNARLLQNDKYMKISNRTLFNTSTIGWRFQRTGYTSFFIYDIYINIFLMMICWILLAIAHYCIKHKINQKKLMSAFYSFTLKVHQITIFYISISTMLEWIYFDAASFQRWLSFSFCILFNIYFLVYELYIYYDMINYPVAAIGNQKYDYYTVRYGSLLKNIRFTQFDPREQWSVKHWFRPYNYHILSYYKKFLMMITLPIFYSTRNAQIGVLMVIQLFQIIRFIIVWPFKSKVRNFIRLGLEICLMIFFMSIIIQSFEMMEIMNNNPDTLEKAVDIFYKIGWLGFAMCWTFNIGHLIIFIYDTVIGCRRSNRQMMDEARKLYYMEKLKSYEQENQDVPLALVNKWVKLGNLNDRKLDDLPDLNLRIEYFKIRKSSNGFQIDIKKLFEVFMNIEFNFQKENNLSTGRKINKRMTLTRSLSPTFYGIIDNLYNEYMKAVDFEFLTIKTFVKVIQSAHKPGQKIGLDSQVITQRIQLETYAGQKKIIKLQKLLPGFPIRQEDLKQLL